MSENETPLKIGQQLKDARVAKGYTLDDLQQATKIQKRYLIAIEDEHFDELPGDFYVRAFVKQYADTVGLDGNELLREYDDYLPQTKTPEYSEHLTQAVETRSGSHHVAADGFDRMRKYIPTAVITLIVVVILGAIWMTAIAKNHSDSATKIDSSSVSVSGESSKKSSSSSKKSSSKLKLTQTSRTTSAVTYSTSSKLKSAKTLSIKAGSSSVYTTVKVDGTSKLAKTLSAKETGKVSIAQGSSTLVITLGSASGVTIKLGNQTINFTNSNKYPSTKTITINFGQSSTKTSSTSSSSSSSTTTSSSTSTSSTSTSTTSTTTASSSSTSSTASSSASSTSASSASTTSQASSTSN